MSVPTSPSEPGAALEQEELPLIQRGERATQNVSLPAPVLPALSGPILTSVSRHIYYSRGNSLLAL